ncbi:hypothetical protein RN001_002998 [Aquatica leii]|uniref:Uncharacterized protein n=1 Tax=Aquatica leii TaxID=1421715 RepID=A0AAN7SKH1_9COLE|nr:hypothetical protein RN001_002998 [Aquatica leii]
MKLLIVFALIVAAVSAQWIGHGYYNPTIAAHYNPYYRGLIATHAGLYAPGSGIEGQYIHDFRGEGLDGQYVHDFTETLYDNGQYHGE